MTRRHSDSGFVALEAVLAITLLLVPIALAALTFPTWSEHQGVAANAAAQAARAAALANTWPAARQAANAAAIQAARNAGLPDDAVTIQLTGQLQRGGTITAHTTITMPAVAVPLLGTIGNWTWSTSHSERVDDYRSFP
jgi:Flp pilus assembly protein TadG